jgi:hypothetical protein
MVEKIYCSGKIQIIIIAGIWENELDPLVGYGENLFGNLVARGNPKESFL